MGDVFRAFDTRFERECTIKQVHLTTPWDSEELTDTPLGSTERVKRELRIMSTISHSNIVSIFDAIHESDQLYIVVELCQVSTAEVIQLWRMCRM